MIRVLGVVLISLWLSACATKPPVQAMAEARAAVQSVKPLYDSNEAKQSKTYKYFQSAEKALMEATQALDAKQYVKAKKKAKQAKQKARLAAKVKH